MIRSKFFWRGAILGVIIPLLVFTVYAVVILKSDIYSTFMQLKVLDVHTHVISLCTLFNLLPFFVFIRKMRYEPSQGILFSTFVIVIIVYVINFLF
jgi:hypothetical protein